jgi:hypothetical protein
MFGLLFCQSMVAQEQSGQQSTQTQTTGSPTAASSAPDDAWYFAVSPYLWFPGAHGTVGAFGHYASAHISPSDLLKHVDFGILGAAEARKKRFLLNGDLMWMRLSENQALPLPGALGAISADFRAGVLIWTSKLGYRVIDQKKFKVDANVGVRYWHVGEKLNFNPSLLGLTFNKSQNWADPLVGGRIQYLLSPKVVVTALGDVGGFDAAANQDYQVAGLLGYRLNPRLILQGGYRYLFIDYRGNNNSVLNLVMSGVIFGVTYDLKPGKGK